MGFQTKIDQLRAFPGHLKSAISSLSDAQLDTPYREGGWTVRQVVHHLPDSHVNAYIRMKLALTEDQPTIKPYDQDAWANRTETKTAPIAESLALLEAIHDRMATLLAHNSEGDWQRSFYHPGDQRVVTLAEQLDLYLAHGQTHLDQILKLRTQMGWL